MRVYRRRVAAPGAMEEEDSQAKLPGEDRVLWAFEKARRRLEQRGMVSAGAPGWETPDARMGGLLSAVASNLIYFSTPFGRRRGDYDTDAYHLRRRGLSGDVAPEPGELSPSEW